LRCGAVVVDHGWAEDSGERSAAVADTARGLGAEPALVVTAIAERSEDAARQGRYAALESVADEYGATLVLLGHSLDDQAETVLLGLARGSGARSLAGMSARRDRFARPLLGVRRSTLRAAAEQAGLHAWDDPSNDDPAFARTRIRRDLLPEMEAALGPGIAGSLARTADLLRADADALDEWAAAADPGGGTLDVEALADLPAAVRRRVLRSFALRSGAPAGALSAAHVLAIEALVMDWHGQGPVFLPTGLRVGRSCGRLAVERPSPPGQSV
jgi:tRNA(Ile)-lysidine synthase